MPDPPENVKCTGVGEDCATIVWEPPKFDGGAPVKGKKTGFTTTVLQPSKDCGFLNTNIEDVGFDSNRLSHGKKEERLLQMD